MNEHCIISDVLIDFVAREEGFVDHAYYDQADVLTIGFGFTRAVLPELTTSSTMSREHATGLLHRLLTDFGNQVQSLVRVPLTQGQFEALTSFAYNVGIFAFGKSTLLKLLNSGDYAGAADQFSRWNKAGGAALDVLTARRRRERALFESLE